MRTETPCYPRITPIPANLFCSHLRRFAGIRGQSFFTFYVLRFFALLFLLSSLICVSARADTPAFQTYTQHDGLAADYVTSVTLTRDSAIWIGTSRGATQVLDKYWVSYTAAHGLGNTWVNGIAVAADGKTYFATNGGGLTLFDGVTRKTFNTSNSAIPSNYLTAVAIDKQNRVWVGTFGAGVARLVGEQWTKYTLANNYINALALDASSNPWVATNDGAFFFDSKKPALSGVEAWTQLTQSSGLASNRVSAVAIAPDGKIWFGTDNGVTVYDGKAYRSYRKTDGLADNAVCAIAVDATRVWVGTARGLSVLEAGKWKTYTRADGLVDEAINAITIDAQKNVWVGTPHGLSVFGGATLTRVTTLPVVLVHGWHTAESDQLDDTEFRFIRKYLEQDGFQVFYAAGISPFKTLFQNAATLRDVIADVKAKTGAPRVDVIAFSMGGLNTRAYLESTLYQNDVRRAITLGTPQAGVRLWYSLLTREIQDRPDEPSAIELAPEYAALFNRTHAPRATVPYDLLVGDARSQTGLDILKNFPPSDGLIDVWSAHALSGPQVRRVLNSDAHDWDPSPLPFALTAYLYPEQTYQRFIRNALRDPDARPIGFAAAPVDPLAPRNITPLNVDPLRAGETITRTILIDANRAARFVARWNRGDVDVKLRAPDGTRYAPGTVRESTSSSDPTLHITKRKDLIDATYLKADIGNFIGYSIPRAQVGTWSLIATRLDKGTEPLKLTTYADLDADVRLDAQTDRAWYPPGAPVVVEASLLNKEAGVDVRVKVEWLGDGKSPRGSAVEAALLEEGEPGTYADVITGLTRGGYYLAHVTARTARYTRGRELIFAVSPKTASFIADVSARADKSALTVAAAVNATRAGEFALGATLRGPHGQLVTSLTAPLTLIAGAQPVSIAIPGRDIRASRIDGPYTVELILMDASWAAVQVDELPKAMTTDAYRAMDFGE